MSLSSVLNKLKEYEKPVFKMLLEEHKRRAEVLSKALGFEIEVHEETVYLLIKQIEKYGKPYCPCRKVTGDPERDRVIICPCKYHVNELKKYHTCLCGLYREKGMDDEEYMERYQKLIEEEAGE